MNNTLKPTRPEVFINAGKRVIDIEAKALSHLSHQIDDSFVKACQLIKSCHGRTIVIGMGKSGHIGHKIAATLASTGTPSFFVHPAEASHGDMGMITSHDVVIALSCSGETEEVTSLIPPLKRLGVPIISICSKSSSTLANNAEVNLLTPIEQEACPLGLAPTASTTVALALGDAIAVALLEARGFTAEDFAFSHPGGSLGRRLLLKVNDIMHQGINLPVVQSNLSISNALLEMTKKGLGMTTVVNTEGQLVGIYTDGDLRRSLNKGIQINTTEVVDEMTRNPRTIDPSCLAAEALAIMEKYSINGLIAVDSDNKPQGALNMQDLIRAKVL